MSVTRPFIIIRISVWCFLCAGLIASGDELCKEKLLAKRVYEAPSWWSLDLEDEVAKAKLEEIVDELLLLDVECFRKVVVEYYENYMGENDLEWLESKATFQLIFYGYCNVDSKDWRWYTGPFNDTQLMDEAWNPGDPWLLDFTDSGVKILARPTSHGGSFGNYEASFNIVKIFEQDYARYGPRSYRPDLE